MDIKMEVDGGGGGGGEGSCQASLDSSMATGLHFIDSGLQVDDVNLVAKQLLHLDDVGNREEFHRQCCEVSCCTAKEVIQIMRNQSYKVSLLQITSESFLLQDLLNPTHYDCTEELLNSWLLVQEDEDQGTTTILENINKMLALVESVEHLVIFLRSILKRFGSRFLGLCTSLALRALKQQRHLTSIDGNQMDDGCKKKLAQTVELISQLFHGNCRRLYLSCLLTLLYVDPSDVRYFALETHFLRSPDGKVIGSVDSSVDQGIYSDLLSTVNLLRPMSLDIDLDWPHLKVIAMDLLYRAGYQYEPANNTFRHREPSSAKVCANWGRLGVGIGVGDGSGFATKILATNGEKVTAEGGGWCSGGGGSFYLSSDLRTVTWPQGDHAVLSQNFDSLYEVVKADNQTAEKDAKVWNNGTSDTCPVSLAVALSESLPMDSIAPANDNCRSISSSADGGTMLGTDGISTGPDDKWEARQLWQTASCQGKALDTPGIVSVEKEEGDSVLEENSTSPESSTFPKKRSISAEVVALTETAEPSQKLRTVGSNRFKVLRRNRDKDEGENLGTEADTRHKTSDECSHSKRFLRPKDRFLRAQANVTRKTFLFKYTFPKRHQAKEAGKRSASESAVSCNDGISAAKSKYSLPNGIELKNCFIRLNRIESDGGEQEPEAEDEKPVFEEMKLENGVREEPAALPDELFMQTSLMKEEVTEEKVVQCVCDGCGEVVPDCSWLTAHIVTCTGRPDCGNNDDNAVTDEELAGSFQQDAPIWDPMEENRESVSENTIVIVPTTDSSCVNGSLGNILSIESSSDIASFTPQNSSEVDPANLMNHLLQNQDNTSSSSSSFIYETASSDNVGGLKVIQISNGDASYSMSNQQQSATGDVSDEQFGKGIVYNGVYMYEFAEYQCNMCLLAFTSQAAAAEHVQSSDHGQSTVSRNSFCCCLKCSIRYREKHIMWLHSQYTCGNVADELTDESRFYRCLLCCKAFLSSAFLRRHVYLQHGRELGLGSFVAAQRQLVETVTDGIGIPQLSAQSCSQLGLNDVPPGVPRLADYRVGTNGSLIGSWYQVNDGTNQMEGQMLEDQPVSVFPMQTQDAADAPDPKSFSQQAKATERNATAVQDTASAGASGENGSADSQALLDLACSIVLGGCSSPPANFTDSSVPVSASHSTTVAAAATAAPAASVSSSKSAPSNQSRRTAKGIMYKNVFMQCIVNYLCSTCKKDLSTKASKKEHKSASCFDADSKRFTYLRQYSYLCPYCSEKFPSQKFCRQHQLSVCLQLMGVKTDELNHKQLLCPFCDRKYFNIITLKGHMTLIHKVNKIDSSQILGSSGLLDELISYAPDGLSEKAKDAKRKVKDENERRTMEENGGLPPKDVAVAVAKKPVTPVDANVPADIKSEVNSNAEAAADGEKAASTKEISEDSSGAWANQNPGRNRPGTENGVNVDDSGQECSLNDTICDVKDDIDAANVDIKEELDQNDLHIDAEEEEEEEEDDDLIFDADASNDFTSTDELSEFDEEMSRKADDSVLVKAELCESHFGKTDEVAEGKKSLKRRKSRKTRKKVATKSGRRLH